MFRNPKSRVGLAAAGAMLLCACTSADVVSTQPDGDEFSIAVAYDLGGRGDGGFNDLAYSGAERAAEELDGEVVEATARTEDTDADREDRLRLMAERGADVVVAVGFLYATAVVTVAEQFPDTWFAIVDDDTVEADNVVSLIFAANEGSFLVGVAAGSESQTGRVGFIGGVNTPLIEEFQAGYEAGVLAVSSDTDIEVTYLTQPPDFNGFNDPQRGAESASGMYDSGVDIIFAAAGGSGHGVFESARRVGAWAIGVDNDQYESTEPPLNEVIITSMLKHVDVGVHGFATSVADGSVTAGTALYDLAGSGVGYSTAGDQLSAETISTIEEFAAQIESGAISVPTSPSG